LKNIGDLQENEPRAKELVFLEMRLRKMSIEIVSIGDELLRGAVINTNAAFLSEVLYANGYEISRHTVFSDDPPILDKELRAADRTLGGAGARVLLVNIIYQRRQG
jgi:hypothetical protein